MMTHIVVIFAKLFKLIFLNIVSQIGHFIKYISRVIEIHFYNE